MKIKNIAVIGGGTAGWLAANHLGVELSHDPEIQITVIESDEVPSIGVGEGTVPFIKQSLRKFGISEAELLATCEVTFKEGIKFINWMASENQDHFYYHPFASPYPEGIDLTEYMLTEGKVFHDLASIVKVAEAGKCPKKISSAPYLGEVDYAYHFNAAKFADLLKNNAMQRFGVRHQLGTVQGAELSAEGFITHLIFKAGEKQPFDFYVDCSGFSSVIIDKTLKVPFVDQSHKLLTDSALVMQVPITEADELFPYTKATAHSAGWVWDIPLTSRRGVGFVFSSAHMTEAEAIKGFASYLGVSEDNFAPRKLAMKIGYREDFWRANCVSLGLAQGFVEPLEATSILVSDFSAGILAKNFPKYLPDIEKLSGYCNRAVSYTWQRVIDFIQLHYKLSDRRDSAFWRDVTEKTPLSSELSDHLEKWKLQPPQKSDFFSRFELFDVDNYLYVLYGMKFPTRTSQVPDGRKKIYASILDRVNAKADVLAHNLAKQKLWLAQFNAEYEKMLKR